MESNRADHPKKVLDPSTAIRAEKVSYGKLGPTEEGKLRLVVREAYWDDFRKESNLAGRIGRKNMDYLRVRDNDVIEIRREVAERLPDRRTVVKCLQLLSLEADNDSVIRIDGVVRYNVNVAIGDIVVISKVENLPQARQVTFTHSKEFELPAEIMQGRYLHEKLMGSPLAINNDISIRYGRGSYSFKVIELSPAEIVVVTKDTLFKILAQ